MSAVHLVSLDVGDTLLRLPRQGLATRLLATVSDAEERQRLRDMLLTRRLSRNELVRLGLGQVSSEEPPGAGELSERVASALAALSARCTVVTLSNTTALDALRPDPLTERFPQLRRYRSFETGYAKPDPRAFHKVLEAEHVEARRAVHMGDNWTADVRGALSAGLRAIWISTDRPPSSSPESLLGTVADLPAAVSLLDERGLL